MTNRIALVAQKVIQPSQSTFMKGRNIGRSGHFAWNQSWDAREKLDVVILKLDFEKAYDKVK